MNLNIDMENGTARPFTVVLSTRDHRHLGEILNVSGMKYTCYLNQAPKLSFTVSRTVDGRDERLWDQITGLRLVYVKEVQSYFEITVSLDESGGSQKTVTGTSVCECELSQKMLSHMEINTEDEITREDYVPTRFYHPEKPEASLLHRVLREIPAYTLKHVDASLAALQRSFSIHDCSIYDFLTGECAEEFHCLFQFDSVHRTISAYDLYTVCQDCGHRGNISGACPKCGSSRLKYFGEDTTILVTAGSLTDQVQLETDTEEVKNCFLLEAGDETMTAAALSYLPGGGSRIFHFSEEQARDMPPALAEKIRSYNVLYDSQMEGYNTIVRDIYECIERISYFTSRQMPETAIPKVTAVGEAAKLTSSALSPLALSVLNSYTSPSTVNSALLNYAKVFVKSGFVKLQVEGASFQFHGNSDGTATGTWTGQIRVTSYSDKQETALSNPLTITVNDDMMTFMEEKIRKNIAASSTSDSSVYDVLTIQDTAAFSRALELYGLNRLLSFQDALGGVLSVLQEAGGGNSDSELYRPFYAKYYDKLTACKSEIQKRKTVIEEWQRRKEDCERRKEAIQKKLDFQDYIGTDLYHIFTTYARESRYSNSNYISDGLSEDEIFKKAQEFVERAQRELEAASCPRHSIRANLYNLLLLEDFAPIVDHFELGSWIRVQADDRIYRLRLISYEIDFDSLSRINTEFSDVTRTAEGISDAADILKQADSIAKTYSTVSKQASEGLEAEKTLEGLRKEGLDSALYAIKNADSEEITLGKNGLLARSYDDITDTYSDEQLILTHNILAYTTDGMRTIRSALGKMKLTVDGRTDYEYGLNADFCLSSKIIAGNIYSANYSSAAVKGTRLNLNDGTFTFADGKVVFDGNKLKLKGVEIDWNTTNESTTMWAGINANTQAIRTEASRATEAEGTLRTSLTQTADTLRLEADNMKKGLEASLSLTAGAIRTEVSQTYQTKTGAQAQYSSLSSSISQAAGQIVLKADAGGRIVKAALNADPSTGTEFKVSADNISLSANDVLNLLAGGTMNLTAQGINITSENWGVDSQGHMWCNSIKAFQITGEAVKQFNTAMENSEAMALATQAIGDAQSAANTANSGLHNALEAIERVKGLIDDLQNNSFPEINNNIHNLQIAVSNLSQDISGLSNRISSLESKG